MDAVGFGCYVYCYVYPQGVVCKRKLGADILEMVVSFSGECILVGDFNEVRDESERLGSYFNSMTAKHFNDFRAC